MAEPPKLRKYGEPLYDLQPNPSRKVDEDYRCPSCGKTMIWHPQVGHCIYRSRSPGEPTTTLIRELCDGSVVEQYQRQ
jgi:hypothetical protein